MRHAKLKTKKTYNSNKTPQKTRLTCFVVDRTVLPSDRGDKTSFFQYMNPPEPPGEQRQQSSRGQVVDGRPAELLPSGAGTKRSSSPFFFFWIAPFSALRTLTMLLLCGEAKLRLSRSLVEERQGMCANAHPPLSCTVPLPSLVGWSCDFTGSATCTQLLIPPSKGFPRCRERWRGCKEES